MRPGDIVYDIRTGREGKYCSGHYGKNKGGKMVMAVVYWFETKKTKQVARKYLKKKPIERVALKQPELTPEQAAHARNVGLGPDEYLAALAPCGECERCSR